MRLSVVIPCFNEEHGIDRLHVVLAEVLPGVSEDFEVLLVDDGSQDGTLSAMRRLAAADPRFRYLALSRNFGKEAAMLAGLSQATGDVVAIMDADLQHPPQLLAGMVALLGQGHDQVVARRTRSGEPTVRRLLSRLYYRMINKVVDVELEDGVGDFRVLSRRAVRALLSLGEYNRFSKGLFAWIGFDTAVVDYDNVQRAAGSSKFTFRKLLNYGIDGVVSFNNKPLRAAIYLGGLVTVLSFTYAAFVLVDSLTRGVDVPGYATLMVGVAGLGGLQLLFLGVLGEYLGRIYYETKRRPHFLVKEASGPADPPVSVPLGPHAEQIAEFADQLELHGHAPVGSTVPPPAANGPREETHPAPHHPTVGASARGGLGPGGSPGEDLARTGQGRGPGVDASSPEGGAGTGPTAGDPAERDPAGRDTVGRDPAGRDTVQEGTRR
ncbi:glycosyltransferase family 2 protein [Streptoalloteichus hindustanus]|uniref:Glycosyltransferase involved in cell wall bisynthesis n=1 Tax=Streptoalloteichus hindustanus TaxID=2017 RepID=A0A1M4VIL7_STRHI|nr:glycosyltransferase family 2 protein [Streptoalloteichus hindustanus]SHE68871.1 Glycosyltransferase involved in cell wall bisynthesis [Streptoalloteichus hindustanus]